jgi:hypothetical protein
MVLHDVPLLASTLIPCMAAIIGSGKRGAHAAERRREGERHRHPASGAVSYQIAFRRSFHDWLHSPGCSATDTCRRVGKGG